MTATPTTPDYEKFGRTLRKAGSIFGFDLASLFEDEEGEAVEGFEGFAPTFRVESQLKGRSPSTMTYKAPKTPSRTAVFELAPKLPSAIGGEGGGTTVNIQMPTAEKEEEKEEAPVFLPPVQERADRLLSSFIGKGGTGGAIGAMGVGRAMEFGYTPEEILSKARAENLTFGEQAARSLGISTDLKGYTGEGATAGALGQAAVERMRAGGLSDVAIRSLAQQQGLKFGESAAKNLGVSAAKTYQRPASAAPAIASYAASPSQGGTAGAIGLAGIQRAAAAQGITPQQAAQRALAQGTQLGEAARALLR